MIQNILHPQWIRCPLKSDQIERKSSLPTIMFMLVFWGAKVNFNIFPKKGVLSGKLT